MSNYRTLITARIAQLSRQYTEVTGRKAFICWLPSKYNHDTGVYFFTDGTVLESPVAALDHMEFIWKISPIWVREK